MGAREQVVSRGSGGVDSDTHRRNPAGILDRQSRCNSDPLPSAAWTELQREQDEDRATDVALWEYTLEEIDELFAYHEREEERKAAAAEEVHC